MVRFWELVQTSVQMEIFRKVGLLCYIRILLWAKHHPISTRQKKPFCRLVVKFTNHSFATAVRHLYIRQFDFQLYRVVAHGCFSDGAVRNVALSEVILQGALYILHSSCSTKELTTFIVATFIATAICHPVRCSRSTNIYLLPSQHLRKGKPKSIDQLPIKNDTCSCRALR